VAGVKTFIALCNIAFISNWKPLSEVENVKYVNDEAEITTPADQWRSQNDNWAGGPYSYIHVLRY
jgi:hypothetical protein